MLRTSVQSQQQFIANTAHQLRTPITGMQAQLDILAAEPAAAPIKNRLATLQEAIRQLAHSANQLLSLARADRTVNLAAKNQAVSLKTIAEEVVAKFFDRALQAHIDLGADAAPASIRADPSLLDDLLSNLVDNALKYTPARRQRHGAHGSTEGNPSSRWRTPVPVFRRRNGRGYGKDSTACRTPSAMAAGSGLR